MPARTQNVSQHVLTKSLPCQRGLKMSWPNLPDASEDRKWISTCGVQTFSMPAKTKIISWCVDQIPTKMYLNMNWPNPSHDREDTKCISHACEKPKCIATCVDRTIAMPARTQNVSLHVLTKPYPCQRGYKMHLNMCWLNQWGHKMYLKMNWTNPWNHSEDKIVSPTRARKRNASQHVLTKTL